jgi:hypothetical protein
VERDGGITSYPSSIPSVVAVDVHERSRLGFRAYWTRRLRLRFHAGLRMGPPRMPRDAFEADAVFFDWDRLNGRYFAERSVRMVADGRVLPKVTFDTLTWLAVMDGEMPVRFRASLWGQAIELVPEQPLD